MIIFILILIKRVISIQMEIYHSLYENTKNLITPLSDIQKVSTVQLIPKLDQKGHDLLFFLIRMYHNQQTHNVSFHIPYQAGSKEDKTNDVEFDLDNFPVHLQHILYMFVRMHYEYISYESSRS